MNNDRKTAREKWYMLFMVCKSCMAKKMEAPLAARGRYTSLCSDSVLCTPKHCCIHQLNSNLALLWQIHMLLKYFDGLSPTASAGASQQESPTKSLYINCPITMTGSLEVWRQYSGVMRSGKLRQQRLN